MTSFPRSTVCLIAAATMAFRLGAAGGDIPDPTAAQIDDLFAQWDRNDSPGAAVVVVKDGKIVYQHGYGCADVEHHVRNTPQTLFDVASVAKQFTGLSVAILVQQGKLSLDDDIHKYLPDVPDFGTPIRIEHLLRHTSGLRDWPETLELSGINMSGPITLDAILEMVRRQRELDFVPGAEEQYSNTGYNLLAATIAKISGQSFRTWIRSNLFQPLGMKSAQICDDPAEIIPDCACSYAPAGPGKFQRLTSQLAAQGSSSLFISAEEMGGWLLNFDTARVGGRAAIEMMQQPGKLNSGASVKYGFGLGLGAFAGIRRLTHGGSWAGYRSFTMWMPEKHYGIAILANTTDVDTYALGMKITRFYLGTPDVPSPKTSDKPDVATAFKAEPASWNSFLGTYRLGPGWLLTITREGDQLMAQATHENRFPMTPISETNFFVDAYGSSVAFVRNDSGTVTNLIYRGNSAPKLGAPELTPASLAAYTGDYWSEELRVIARLAIDDGKLAYRTRSGNWIHLLPTGPDQFDADADGFTVEFTRNAAAKITELKISGSRVRHLRYARITLPGAQPATNAR